MWTLSLLLPVVFPLLILAEKVAVLQAAYKTERELESDTFHEWFQHRDTPYHIMCANPGLAQVEKLSSRTYRGHLTPIRSFGVDVYQVIDFDVSSNGTSFIVKSEKGMINSTYKGMLKSLVSSFTSLHFVCCIGTRLIADMLDMFTPDDIESIVVTSIRKCFLLFNYSCLSVFYELCLCVCRHGSREDFSITRRSTQSDYETPIMEHFPTENARNSRLSIHSKEAHG